ncbi:MAG: Mfa1 fimbrilin C-terminal domain-containing protein [Muribaculaceae bacterium]|nr:Mfa1 fimbrilin C-terminal domain-containing protein [Muribaculaceae bacterium]
MPLAALALMASCSNDNIDAPQTGADPAPETLGNVFMNLTLSMPSDKGPGTKAESFDDGSEYDVEDAKLFIFNEDGNKAGTCVAALTLSFDDPGITGGGTTNVTGTLDVNKIQMPKEVEKKSGTNYYALVILNTKYINCPVVGTSTWDSWSTSAQDKSVSPMMDSNKKYFTMTNALGLTGEITENSVPTQLVKFGDSNLYYETDTPKPSALAIYVQRVVAKVTLGTEGNIKVGDDFSSLNGNSGAATTDKVKLTNWYLDVENGSTYPVQLMENTTTKWNNSLIADWSTLTEQTKRFLGSQDDFNRVYWAIDPNYDADQGTAPKTNTESSNDKDAKFYPFENTFSIANMVQSQSTRIVFEGVYAVGGKTTDVPSFVGYNGLYKAVENLNTEANKSGKNKKLADIVNDDAELKSLASYFNVATDAEVIDFYFEGKVYYTAIIRHFEDDDLGIKGNLSPWELKYENYTKIPESETVKGDNYLLGRYGVVRNNWYIININKVTGPGEPVVPTPDPNTPDDKPAKFYLDADINILSWAKRSHGYDL